MAKDAAKDTVIVIFGCRYQSEYLSRVYAATKFVREKRISPTFIFTGIDPLPFSQYRIDKFLKYGSIIWEDQSTDTESNVKNTIERIGVRILNRYDIFIVSSWYHIPKIKLFWRRMGVNIPKQNFIRSYENVQLINVLIEPFALLAAYLRINHWPIITLLKRRLGYNV